MTGWPEGHDRHGCNAVLVTSRSMTSPVGSSRNLTGDTGRRLGANADLHETDDQIDQAVDSSGRHGTLAGPDRVALRSMDRISEPCLRSANPHSAPEPPCSSSGHGNAVSLSRTMGPKRSFAAVRHRRDRAGAHGTGAWSTQSLSWLDLVPGNARLERCGHAPSRIAQQLLRGRVVLC